jgi:hypothetical protein
LEFEGASTFLSNLRKIEVGPLTASQPPNKKRTIDCAEIEVSSNIDCLPQIHG